MRYIEAKSIVSSWSEGKNWFGNNYNMNIYRGCNHGCIYCDSRSDCYHVENFDEVRAKENALLILERDLKSKRKKGLVSNGAMSDPYNPFEAKYQLTRGALELIHKHGFGAGIITKSDLVTRDIDLLTKIREHSPAMVKMTITTFEDALCQKIETGVTPTSKRLTALKQLSQAGIFTGVLLMPILPFINDTEENIKNIVQAAAENGVDFIFPAFGVTLRQNQRVHFYQQLDKTFPGLKQKYINTFGNNYECFSPNKKNLYEVFKTECEKNNILYKMPQIIEALKSDYQPHQLSFL